MNTVTFQMIAVVALGLFTLTEWVGLRFGGGFRDGFDRDEKRAMWILHAERVGQKRMTWMGRLMRIAVGSGDYKNEVALDQEQYYVGNRYRDSFFIDAPGPRVKLLLNVQEQVVYMSVLKGSVHIANYEYEANVRQRIPLREFDKVRVGSVSLQFRKGGKYNDTGSLHRFQR